MQPRVHSAPYSPRLAAAVFCLMLLGPIAHAADPIRNGEQQLAAAEAAMNVGEDRKAESLLSAVPPSSLSLPQMARAQLLRAEISLKRGMPMAALRALPSGSDHVPLYGERIEALRAEALFQLGDAVAATRSLVQRERFLQGDAEAIADNRERIWQGLIRAPLTRDDAAKIAVQDAISRGWLDLALQRQLGAAARYDTWTRQYPHHPATPRVAALSRVQSAASVASPVAGITPAMTATTMTTTLSSPPAISSPRGSGGGVALLVPLTGPLAGTGEAVLAGAMAAAGTGSVDLRHYDAGATPDQALVAYQQALADNPAVIIGPLQREAVAAIARLGTPTVPIVALNALDDDAVAPANFLQFGLAPEDEARAAAEQAVARNLRRAIALVPSSDWGRRVFAAFATRLRDLGGAVTASDTFQSGTVDPSKLIKRLLGLEASEARHKALTTVLGRDTEFDGRRRGDVDFIFLAAKPSDSRVILPQLRFFRAGNLPIYSTSLIYEGHGIDWGSMQVCDMPWMLDTNGPWVAARTAAVQQQTDAMRSYPRLVALGADGWRLANQIREQRGLGTARIDGATGALTVGGSGRVSRSLSCAAPHSALKQALDAIPATTAALPASD